MSNVVLRKLEIEDATFMLEWMKDPEVNRWFKMNSAELTLESVNHFILENIEQTATSKNIHFAIANESNDYCGTVSLKNIDYQSLNAEYAIVLRRNAQGKGMGRFATDEILSYAFMKLNLHKVYMNVLSNNETAIQFYIKYGFRYEGESIEQVRIGDNFCSLKWFSILKAEWSIKKKEIKHEINE